MPVAGNARRTSALPRWARLADAIVVAGLGLGAFVWWWGSRWMIGGHRISVSPGTLLVCITAVAAVRHLVFRRPALHERLLAPTSATLPRAPALSAALPCWIVTRCMVLTAGLIAIVMIGYPEGAPRISAA